MKRLRTLKQVAYGLLLMITMIGVPQLAIAQQATPVVEPTEVDGTPTPTSTTSETPTIPVAPMALIGGVTNWEVVDDSIPDMTVNFVMGYDLTIPSTAVGGDTIEITNTNPNVVYFPSTVELRDSENNLIGIAVTTADKVTITLDPFVTTQFGIEVSGTYSGQFTDACYGEPFTDTVGVITSDGTTFSDTIDRGEYICIPRGPALWKAGGIETRDGQTVIVWGVDTGAGHTGTHSYEDVAQPGWEFRCDEIALIDSPYNANVTLTVDHCDPTLLQYTVSGMTDGAQLTFLANRTPGSGPDYENCVDQTAPVELADRSSCTIVRYNDGGSGGGSDILTPTDPTTSASVCEDFTVQQPTISVPADTADIVYSVSDPVTENDVVTWTVTASVITDNGFTPTSVGAWTYVDTKTATFVAQETLAECPVIQEPTDPIPTPAATEPIETPTATMPIETPTATMPIETPTATEPAPPASGIPTTPATKTPVSVTNLPSTGSGETYEVTLGGIALLAVVGAGAFISYGLVHRRLKQ